MDFSGKEYEAGKSNITVTKTDDENGNTKLTFDLGEDLNVNNITANHMYTTETTNEDNSVVNVKYFKDKEMHIMPTTEGKEYTVEDDGTVTLKYADGNGNEIDGVSAQIKGLASDKELATAKTTVKEGTNVKVTSTDKTLDGHTEYTVNAYDTQITGDENVSVTGGELNEETNVRNYNVKLADVVTVGTSENAEHPVKIDGVNGTITGLTNTTTDYEGFATEGEGKAATEEQLKSVMDSSYKGWKVSANGENSTTVASDKTVDFSGKEYEAGKSNITVTKTDDENGNTKLTFDLDDKLVIGNNNQITIDGSNGNASLDLGTRVKLDGVAGTAKIGGVAVNNTYGQDGKVTSSTIDGLTNKTWDSNNQAQYEDSGKAATEAQLYDAIGTATSGMYKGWSASAEGGTGVAVPSGGTVDFAGVKGTDKNGEEYQNIVVSQDPNNPDLKFDLNDKVVLGEGDNQVILDGTTGNITSNSANIANTVINSNGIGINVNGKTEYYITDEGLNANDHKITGVQAGKAPTDAVNVSQLNEAISGTYGGWSVSANGGEGVDVPTDGNVDFSSADNAEGTKNIVIAQDGTNLTFDLSDRLVLGEGSNTVVIDGMNGSAFFGGSGGVSISRDAGHGNGYIISGLANTEWDYTKYKNGEYKTNNAATESQLHSAFEYLDKKINEGIGSGDITVGNDDDNISVRPGDEKNPNDNDFNVGLNNDVTLGGDDNNDGIISSEEEGSFAVVTGTDENGNPTKVTINNDKDGLATISGLENTEWDYNKYKNGDYAQSTNGATEAQLHQALGGTVQYDRNDDGTVNKGSITLNEGGTTIHNVAPGEISENSMDAVNGSQLWQTQQQVDNNTTAINNMGNQINRLGDRIDKVGADAAALAALHPLDFDPDDKLSFAAGYGNYAGENAVAIGAFYQPNEDTLFSVGGTVGNDENMVNVGVSFKLGQKNHVSNNRVAMAKEIISLRDKMAQLEALLAHQGVLPQGQIDTSRLFPDVPENHWAYEYVHELAKLGIVEGYPDGNYDGDRMMTRYEMAAIIYRAMQKGVNVNRRMLTEFEPELKLIRVDVVAKDRDGNPTIERVRINEPEQQQA